MGLLDQFRSFGQGASNAVAGNVSGPVDGLAWMLRKAGLPIPQNPVGGSDWMAQQGLTAKPQNAIAGLLGETAGLLAPFAPAKKIAGGLLSLDDKAMDMARKGIEGRMVGGGMIQPATVWHGSPHKFDKFDASKIGTGEGAQAYGHGIYTAESPDVARSYVQSVVANSDELAKRGASHGLPADVASNLIAAKQSGKNFDAMIDAAKKAAENPLLPQSQKMAAQRLVDNEMQAYNAWSDWSKPGNLYKVDLPDDQIAKMLDWDKPISEQPQAVRDALAKLPKGWATGSGGQRQFIDPAMSRKTGGGLLEELRMLRRGQPEELLKQQGIPGIRYLDGGSRGAGQGSSNFVVFPGNESLLQILERNGAPIK